MKRTLLAASLAALVSGAIAALATVVPVNPQLCQIPQTCVDMNAQFVPLMNSAALLSPANLGVNTVASLGTTCTAAQKGQVWMVTDSTTPAYNATIVGGGAVITLVACNGTNWTAH